MADPDFYKSQRWKNLARQVRIKYDNRCARCGRKVWGSNSQVHHIIPLSDGGRNHFDNLILLCARCHSRAHGRNMYIRDYYDL